MSSAASRDPAIIARGVRKRYLGGDGTPLQVLDGVDLEVHAGEMVSVIGQSGSGKSTLLHVLGGLDRPDEGTVLVGGTDLATLSDDARTLLRGRQVGFVFQFHHLLREFSALENVMMPQLVGGVSAADAERRARELLDEVGLGPRSTHKPGQLSGGEQQRVAVARALANRPLAVLADEPSGNLDPGTSERLHDLLFHVCRVEGAAMILVTHDLTLAARADRILRVSEGRLVPGGAEVAAPLPEPGK